MNEFDFLAPDGLYYTLPASQFSTAYQQGGVPIEIQPDVSVLSPAGALELVPHRSASALIREQGYKLVNQPKPLRMAGPDRKLYDIAPEQISAGLEQGGTLLLKEISTSKPLSSDMPKLEGEPPESPFSNWFGPKPKEPERVRGWTQYQKILESNRKGRAGFVEGITPSAENIPFAGAAMAAVDLGKLAITAKNIRDGKSVSDQDVMDLNLYMAAADRMSNATMLGKTGKVIVDMVTFASEIGASIAAGLATLGFGGVAAAGESIATRGAIKVAKEVAERAVGGAVKKITVAEGRAALKKTATNAAEKYVEKLWGKTAAELAATKLGRASLAAPGALADVALATIAPTITQLGAQGAATLAAGQGLGTRRGNQDALFAALKGEPTTETTSFWRGLGDTTIENWSEAMGMYLMGGFSAIPGAGALGRAIKQATGKFWTGIEDTATRIAAENKTAGLNVVSTWLAKHITKNRVSYPEAMKSLRSIGYDGVFGEMMEERAGDFMRGLFGLEGEPDDNAVKRAFKNSLPSPEQLGVELLAFSAPMVAIGGAHMVVNFKGFDETMRVREAFNTAAELAANPQNWKDGKLNDMTREQVEPAIKAVARDARAYGEESKGALRYLNAALDYVLDMKYSEREGRFVSNPDIRFNNTMSMALGNAANRAYDASMAEWRRRTGVSSDAPLDTPAAIAAVKVAEDAGAKTAADTMAPMSGFVYSFDANQMGPPTEAEMNRRGLDRGYLQALAEVGLLHRQEDTGQIWMQDPASYSVGNNELFADAMLIASGQGHLVPQDKARPVSVRSAPIAYREQAQRVADAIKRVNEMTPDDVAAAALDQNVWLDRTYQVDDNGDPANPRVSPSFYLNEDLTDGEPGSLETLIADAAQNSTAMDSTERIRIAALMSGDVAAFDPSKDISSTFEQNMSPLIRMLRARSGGEFALAGDVLTKNGRRFKVVRAQSNQGSDIYTIAEINGASQLSMDETTIQGSQLREYQNSEPVKIGLTTHNKVSGSFAGIKQYLFKHSGYFSGLLDSVRQGQESDVEALKRIDKQHLRDSGYVSSAMVGGKEVWTANLGAVSDAGGIRFNPLRVAGSEGYHFAEDFWEVLLWRHASNGQVNEAARLEAALGGTVQMFRDAVTAARAKLSAVVADKSTTRKARAEADASLSALKQLPTLKVGDLAGTVEFLSKFAARYVSGYSEADRILMRPMSRGFEVLRANGGVDMKAAEATLRSLGPATYIDALEYVRFAEKQAKKGGQGPAAAAAPQSPTTPPAPTQGPQTPPAPATKPAAKPAAPAAAPDSATRMAILNRKAQELFGNGYVLLTEEQQQKVRDAIGAAPAAVPAVGEEVLARRAEDNAPVEPSVAEREAQRAQDAENAPPARDAGAAAEADANAAIEKVLALEALMEANEPIRFEFVSSSGEKSSRYFAPGEAKLNPEKTIVYGANTKLLVSAETRGTATVIERKEGSFALARVSNIRPGVLPLVRKAPATASTTEAAQAEPRVSNKQLLSNAHQAFDAIWQSKPKPIQAELRTRLYAELAAHLGILERNAHLGSLTREQLVKAIAWANATKDAARDFEPAKVPAALGPYQTFDIVSDDQSNDTSGMRADGGRSHLNNVRKPFVPGWLGNPYAWEGNGGPKGVTREQVVAQFETDFLNKIARYSTFKDAVLSLRGKKVGYYKPGEAGTHIRVVQRWLSHQPPSVASAPVEPAVPVDLTTKTVEELRALSKAEADKVYAAPMAVKEPAQREMTRILQELSRRQAAKPVAAPVAEPAAAPTSPAAEPAQQPKGPTTGQAAKPGRDNPLVKGIKVRRKGEPRQGASIDNTLPPQGSEPGKVMPGDADQPELPQRAETDEQIAMTFIDPDAQGPMRDDTSDIDISEEGIEEATRIYRALPDEAKKSIATYFELLNYLKSAMPSLSQPTIYRFAARVSRAMRPELLGNLFYAFVADERFTSEMRANKLATISKIVSDRLEAAKDAAAPTLAGQTEDDAFAGFFEDVVGADIQAEEEEQAERGETTDDTSRATSDDSAMANKKAAELERVLSKLLLPKLVGSATGLHFIARAMRAFQAAYGWAQVPEFLMTEAKFNAWAEAQTLDPFIQAPLSEAGALALVEVELAYRPYREALAVAKAVQSIQVVPAMYFSLGPVDRSYKRDMARIRLHQINRANLSGLLRRRVHEITQDNTALLEEFLAKQTALEAKVNATGSASTAKLVDPKVGLNELADVLSHLFWPDVLGKDFKMGPAAVREAILELRRSTGKAAIFKTDIFDTLASIAYSLRTDFEANRGEASERLRRFVVTQNEWGNATNNALVQYLSIPGFDAISGRKGSKAVYGTVPASALGDWARQNNNVERLAVFVGAVAEGTLRDFANMSVTEMDLMWRAELARQYKAYQEGVVGAHIPVFIEAGDKIERFYAYKAPFTALYPNGVPVNARGLPPTFEEFHAELVKPGGVWSKEFARLEREIYGDLAPFDTGPGAKAFINRLKRDAQKTTPKNPLAWDIEGGLQSHTGANGRPSFFVAVPRVSEGAEGTVVGSNVFGDGVTLLPSAAKLDQALISYGVPPEDVAAMNAEGKMGYVLKLGFIAGPALLGPNASTVLIKTSVQGTLPLLSRFTRVAGDAKGVVPIADLLQGLAELDAQGVTFVSSPSAQKLKGSSPARTVQAQGVAYDIYELPTEAAGSSAAMELSTKGRKGPEISRQKAIVQDGSVFALLPENVRDLLMGVSEFSSEITMAQLNALIGPEGWSPAFIAKLAEAVEAHHPQIADALRRDGVAALDVPEYADVLIMNMGKKAAAAASVINADTGNLTAVASVVASDGKTASNTTDVKLDIDGLRTIPSFGEVEFIDTVHSRFGRFYAPVVGMPITDVMRRANEFTGPRGEARLTAILEDILGPNADEVETTNLRNTLLSLQQYRANSPEIVFNLNSRIKSVQDLRKFVAYLQSNHGLLLDAAMGDAFGDAMLEPGNKAWQDMTGEFVDPTMIYKTTNAKGEVVGAGVMGTKMAADYRTPYSGLSSGGYVILGLDTKSQVTVAHPAIDTLAGRDMDFDGSHSRSFHPAGQKFRAVRLEQQIKDAMVQSGWDPVGFPVGPDRMLKAASSYIEGRRSSYRRDGSLSDRDIRLVQTRIYQAAGGVGFAAVAGPGNILALDLVVPYTATINDGPMAGEHPEWWFGKTEHNGFPLPVNRRGKANYIAYRMAVGDALLNTVLDFIKSADKASKLDIYPENLGLFMYGIYNSEVPELQGNPSPDAIYDHVVNHTVVAIANLLANSPAAKLWAERSALSMRGMLDESAKRSSATMKAQFIKDELEARAKSQIGELPVVPETGNPDPAAATQIVRAYEQDIATVDFLLGVDAQVREIYELMRMMRPKDKLNLNSHARLLAFEASLHKLLHGVTPEEYGFDAYSSMSKLNRRGVSGAMPGSMLESMLKDREALLAKLAVAFPAARFDSLHAGTESSIVALAQAYLDRIGDSKEWLGALPQAERETAAMFIGWKAGRGRKLVSIRRQEDDRGNKRNVAVALNGFTRADLESAVRDAQVLDAVVHMRGVSVPFDQLFKATKARVEETLLSNPGLRNNAVLRSIDLYVGERKTEKSTVEYYELNVIDQPGDMDQIQAAWDQLPADLQLDLYEISVRQNGVSQTSAMGSLVPWVSPKFLRARQPFLEAARSHYRSLTPTTFATPESLTNLAYILGPKLGGKAAKFGGRGLQSVVVTIRTAGPKPTIDRPAEPVKVEAKPGVLVPKPAATNEPKITNASWNGPYELSLDIDGVPHILRYKKTGTVSWLNATKGTTDPALTRQFIGKTLGQLGLENVRKPGTPVPSNAAPAPAANILAFSRQNKIAPELSNFEPSPVVDDMGISYPTVEHAFQAAKTLDRAQREAIAKLGTPNEAKQRGRQVTLRQDWEAVKGDVMLGFLRQKFQIPALKAVLQGTGSATLVEDTTGWNDKVWGAVRKADGSFDGENRLGKLLEQVRAELTGSAKVVLPQTSPYTQKDQAKSERANKFIGAGSAASSTEAYRKAWGANANTGAYSATDIVFVSAEGDRSGRKPVDTKELAAAVAAKATIVTDIPADRARPYNVGEREVAAFLAANGYVESAPGTWTPEQIAAAPAPVAPPAQPQSGGPHFIIPSSLAADLLGDLKPKQEGQSLDGVDKVRARINEAFAVGKLSKDQHALLSSLGDKELIDFLNGQASNSKFDNILTARVTPLTPNEDQAAALTGIASFIDSKGPGEARLVGNAGSGKTTIVENIYYYAKAKGGNVLIWAPTNRAVRVLSSKLRRARVPEDVLSTIHKGLYGAPKETGEWVVGKGIPRGALVLVDESSMISADVYADLSESAQAAGAKLLFIGDNYQLEPVGADPKLLIDDSPILPDNRYRLGKVMRQAADSDILTLATYIRTKNGVAIPEESTEQVVVHKLNRSFEDAYTAAMKAAPGETVMITATNQSRVTYNNRARNALHGAMVAKANTLLANEPITGIANSAAMSNGDFATVVDPGTVTDRFTVSIAKGQGRETQYTDVAVERREVTINTWRGNPRVVMYFIPQTLMASVYHQQISKALELDTDLADLLISLGDVRLGKGGKPKLAPRVVIATYGYAVTAHKSQGGEWKAVFVDQDFTSRSWNMGRWLYTAVTRASEKLHIIDRGQPAVKLETMRQALIEGSAAPTEPTAADQDAVEQEPAIEIPLEATLTPEQLAEMERFNEEAAAQGQRFDSNEMEMPQRAEDNMPPEADGGRAPEQGQSLDAAVGEASLNAALRYRHAIYDAYKLVTTPVDTRGRDRDGAQDLATALVDRLGSRDANTRRGAMNSLLRLRDAAAARPKGALVAQQLNALGRTLEDLAKSPMTQDVLPGMEGASFAEYEMPEYLTRLMGGRSTGVAMPDWVDLLNQAANMTKSPITAALIREVLLHPEVQSLQSKQLPIIVIDGPLKLQNAPAQYLAQGFTQNRHAITTNEWSPDRAAIEVSLVGVKNRANDARYNQDQFNRRVMRTLVHEYVHDITYNLLEVDPVFSAEIERLRNLFPESERKAEYGLTNKYEFLAEALSNPEFQSRLNALLDPAANRSLWQSFVDTIKQALRGLIGAGVRSDSVLATALSSLLKSVDGAPRFGAEQSDDEMPEAPEAGRYQGTLATRRKSDGTPDLDYDLNNPASRINQTAITVAKGSRVKASERHLNQITDDLGLLNVLFYQRPAPDGSQVAAKVYPEEGIIYTDARGAIPALGAYVTSVLSEKTAMLAAKPAADVVAALRPMLRNRFASLNDLLAAEVSRQVANSPSLFLPGANWAADLAADIADQVTHSLPDLLLYGRTVRQGNKLVMAARNTPRLLAPEGRSLSPAVSMPWHKAIESDLLPPALRDDLRAAGTADAAAQIIYQAAEDNLIEDRAERILRQSAFETLPVLPQVGEPSEAARRELAMGMSIDSTYFHDVTSRVAMLKNMGIPAMHLAYFTAMNEMFRAKTNSDLWVNTEAAIFEYGSTHLRKLETSANGHRGQNNKVRTAMTKAQRQILMRYRAAVTGVMQLADRFDLNDPAQRQALFAMPSIVNGKFKPKFEDAAGGTIVSVPGFGAYRTSATTSVTGLPEIETIADVLRDFDAQVRPMLLDPETGGRTEDEIDILKVANRARQQYNDDVIAMNGMAAEFLNGRDFLAFRKNYAPQIYGWSPSTDPDGERADTIVSALLKMTDRSQTLLADANGRVDASTLKKHDKSIPTWTDLQQGLLQRIDAEAYANAATADEAPNVVQANRLLLNAIKKKLYDSAYQHYFSSNDPSDWRPSPEEQRLLATMEHLIDILNNYKFVEFSPAEFPRVYKTYVEAYQESQGSLRPKTMDYIELRKEYSDRAYAAAAHKAVMNTYLGFTDPDGKPLIMAKPSRNISLTHGVIKADTWREWSINMARYYNDVYDPNADVIEQARELYDRHASKVHAEQIPTLKLSSIEEFRVTEKYAGKLLKKLLQVSPTETNALARLAYKLVAWSKQLSVGFSGFFYIALAESGVAQSGLGKKNLLQMAITNPKEFKKFWSRVRAFREHRRYYNPEIAADLNYMLRMGMTTGRTAALEPYSTETEKDVAWVAERLQAKYGKAAADRMKWLMFGDTNTKGIAKYWPGITSKGYSDWMFTWFSAFKEAQMDTMVKQLAIDEGFGESTGRLVPWAKARHFAQIMDDGLGGYNWNRMLNVTPRSMFAMTMLLFAPNWTLGSWNAAGLAFLTQSTLRTYYAPGQARFIWTKAMPAMYLYVMMFTPAVLQALTYAAGQLLGGDDDDVPLPIMNETGRKNYVDVTPLLRHSPFYKGDPTGQRRMYIQFAKQIHETGVLNPGGDRGWLNEPLDQFLRKLTLPAKIAYEQLTGMSPGSDWTLEFKNKGFLGIFHSGQPGLKGFMTSRTGYVVQKFMPMSATQFIANPEVFPYNHVAPTSKGTSQKKLVDGIATVLETYASAQDWHRIRQVPAAKAKLESLVPEYLAAAEANGYNPKTVLTSAKGVVLGRLYAKMWQALDTQDAGAANEAAASIFRVGGTLQGLEQSMKNKAVNFGKELTEEQRQMGLRALEQAAMGNW